MSERQAKYSYNSECELLAGYFLANDLASDRAKDSDVKELAQTIQDAIEQWFIGREELRGP